MQLNAVVGDLLLYLFIGEYVCSTKPDSPGSLAAATGGIKSERLMSYERDTMTQGAQGNDGRLQGRLKERKLRARLTDVVAANPWLCGKLCAGLLSRLLSRLLSSSSLTLL